MPDYIWILSRNSYEGSLKQRPCRLQDRIQPDEISGVLWLFAEHSVLGWPMCRGSLEFQGSNAESVSGIMSPNFAYLTSFLDTGPSMIYDKTQFVQNSKAQSSNWKHWISRQCAHISIYFGMLRLSCKNRCSWMCFWLPILVGEWWRMWEPTFGNNFCLIGWGSKETVQKSIAVLCEHQRFLAVYKLSRG